MAIDYEQRAAWHWDRAEQAHTEGDPQLAAEHEHSAGICEQFAHEDTTGTAAA